MQARHFFEYIVVRGLYGIFAALPLRTASACGGWIGRQLGGVFPATQIACNNLLRVMPDLQKSEREKIITDMWDNLGRGFAEYPHLKTIAQGQGGAQIDVVGLENFIALREMGRGGIIVTAHLANWEFGPYLANKFNVPTHVVYRPPNNVLVDGLLARARQGGVISNIAKGPSGAKEIIHCLKNHAFIAMLIDQKMNDGIEVPFLGLPAMTAPAVAQLAIKYQVPICLVRPERINGIHFRWTAFPPFIPSVPEDKDKATAILGVMTYLNDQIGAWIRERPSQWLWLHRRWGK